MVSILVRPYVGMSMRRTWAAVGPEYPGVVVPFELAREDGTPPRTGNSSAFGTRCGLGAPNFLSGRGPLTKCPLGLNGGRPF